MDKYYYMISQLPMLEFDKMASIVEEDFLQEAGKWLSRKDLDILSKVDMRDTTPDGAGPKCWQAYRLFEERFRKDLALWRESMHGGDEARFLSFPVSLIKEGDPLTVEKKILKNRWDFVEELEKEHHFDLDFLILYRIKLQILKRLTRFNKEKGMTIFRDVVGGAYWTRDEENEQESEVAAHS